VKAVYDLAARSMQTSTNGGVSETEVKLFAVNPRGDPSGAIVVTTVTPVANMPSACRNCFGSIASAEPGPASVDQDRVVEGAGWSKASAMSLVCRRKSIIPVLFKVET
jgi:hypothetical protein